jgi:hypothetical protein
MSAYVKVVRSIWTDSEWLELSSTEKLIYLQLISQPNISKCGVLPFVPRRWAHMHPDLGPDELNAAIDSLERLGYVFVDRDTEELLVRTYMRYDEAWRQTNGVRGIQIEAEQIMSKALLQQVLQEFEKASGNPLHKGSDNPCDNPCDNSNATPLTPNPYPNTPNPDTETQEQTSSDDSVAAEIVPDWEIQFEQFYALYPRKKAKDRARAAFKKLKPSDRKLAMSAIHKHIDYWQRERTGMEFIPHPASWLNGSRWDDVLVYEAPKGKNNPVLENLARRYQSEHRASDPDTRQTDRGDNRLGRSSVGNLSIEVHSTD